MTHEKQADGSVKTIKATGAKIMNSPSNIDYTITINGLDLGDPALTTKSLALAYAGVDKRYIEKSWNIQHHDARISASYNFGEIKAEEGMGPALQEKRNNLLVQSIVAKPAQFESVWTAGFQDYLNSGGQAIINERRAKMEAAGIKK